MPSGIVWKLRRLLLVILALSFANERCVATEPVIFRLPYYRDCLTVPVTIAGEAHFFILDTGASTNVFDTDLNSLLGKPHSKIQLHDSHGNLIEVQAFAPPIAHVGKIAIARNALVACFDLTTIRAASGRKIDGILGMPFFATNIVQVDFDQRELRIFPPSVTPQTAWGDPFAVDFTESNLPIVSARIGTEEGEFCTIDLGFTGTLAVRSELFDQLRMSGEIIDENSTKSMSVSGVSKLDKGMLSTFGLAGHIHRKLTVVRSKSADSRMGLDYFRRYLATFDLSDGRVYLARGLEYNSFQDYKPIGIAMLRENGSTVVKDVLPNSRAEGAGFKKGDELVSLSDNQITSQPLAEIRWMINRQMKTDGRLVAVVRRDGLTRSVTVYAVD